MGSLGVEVLITGRIPRVGARGRINGVDVKSWKERRGTLKLVVETLRTDPRDRRRGEMGYGDDRLDTTSYRKKGVIRINKKGTSIVLIKFFYLLLLLDGICENVHLRFSSTNNT